MCDTKIGIDLRPLYDKTGIGRTSRNIVRVLIKKMEKNRFYLFGPVMFNELEKFDNIEFIKVNDSFLYEKIRLPYKIFKYKIDIFISTFFYVPYVNKTKTIFWLHDLTPLILKKYHLKVNHNKMKKFIKSFIRKTNELITVSESEKNNIIKMFPEYQNKIDFIYNGVDKTKFYKINNKIIVNNFLKQEKIDFKYVLYVGTIEPRKNLVKLSNIFNTEFYEKFGVKLILIGSRGWISDTDFKSIINNEYVIWKNNIEDEKLNLYYNCAELLVNPSIYEGFGLPIIESMVCGTPAAVSDIPVFREITLNKMSYFNHNDVNSIKNTVQNCLENKLELSNDYIEKLYDKFNWRNSVEKLTGIIENV